MITIIGMGICQEDVTLRGRDAVLNAKRVFVRTEDTECAKTLRKLGVSYVACDDLYREAEDFDGLQRALVERLLAAGDCAYCVDGDGTEDGIARALAPQCAVSVIAGVSHASSALAVAGVANERVHSLSALTLTREPVFLAPSATLVVTELDDRFLAGEVKLRLLDTYGDVGGFFVTKDKCIPLPVSELDRQKGYGALCAYVLPSIDFLSKQRFNFEDVVYLLMRLRAPDGCEWDKAQTHGSMRDCCIEEAYELVEAIDLDDVDKMVEETGDVLLQAVFHASIAQDLGEFSIADMLSALVSKLIMRHPHVFGDVVATNQEEALAAWDKAKSKEKHQDTYTQKLKDVAPMPALMRCKKIQKIAAKAHYDFASAEDAATKIDEELRELFAATNEDERAMEGGDLLFAAVNVLRLLHVEPELALIASTRKFVDRFAAVEAALAAEGKRVDQVSADELWQVYDRVKETIR
ncbi:MAG: nucleoside triphosphate pyrophosphohydrolase [Clostridia bacterium]|nr:nucleoside triphosphate pyrophosphohydrolase [Clostridia bacterium]